MVPRPQTGTSTSTSPRPAPQPLMIPSDQEVRLGPQCQRVRVSACPSHAGTDKTNFCVNENNRSGSNGRSVCADGSSPSLVFDPQRVAIGNFSLTQTEAQAGLAIVRAEKIVQDFVRENTVECDEGQVSRDLPLTWEANGSGFIARFPRFGGRCSYTVYVVVQRQTCRCRDGSQPTTFR